MSAVVLFLRLVLVQALVSPSCNVSSKLAKAAVAHSDYCPYVWATGLQAPRGVEIAMNNDLLVLESDNTPPRILVLWDDDGDGLSNATERAVLATQTGLNHGIVIDSNQNYLYASTSQNVYRWNYTAGDRSNLGQSINVITNIPCCHHNTRALRISPDHSWLYVQSGSGSNVDQDSTHSQIRRYRISSLGLGSAVNWSDGELIADGLRNTVGIRFDSFGRLWGGDNGVDELTFPAFGGDIHNDNPCEELNLLMDETNSDTNKHIKGAFYGYPYCWSEAIVNGGGGPGTQWLQPDFNNTGVWTNAWCQNVTNVQRPKYCFPAHNAPLDILFTPITNNTNTTNATSSSSIKQIAYMSFHGSWNRSPPDGYVVRQLLWDNNDNITYFPLLAFQGPGATENGWLRPVSLGVARLRALGGNSTDRSPVLLISDDANGRIVALSFNDPNPPDSAVSLYSSFSLVVLLSGFCVWVSTRY